MTNISRVNQGRSTKTIKAGSITKIRNYQIKMKNSFTRLNTIIEDTENGDSDLTNADDDDVNEKSYFQFEETDWFQGVHQTTRVLPNKVSVFNKNLKKD